MSQIPRLSRKEMMILQLLAKKAPEYGLGMVNASGGALKRGTIYVTLNRMEEKGYVTSYKEDQSTNSEGPPRRMYQPTDSGLRVLRAFEQLTVSLLSPAASYPRVVVQQLVGAGQ